MKLRSYLMVAGAAGLLLTSCGDEDATAPIIAEFTVNGTEDVSAGTHLAGDTISISFIATDDDLEGWTLSSEEGTTVVEQASGELSGGSGNVDATFVVPASSQEGDVIILTAEVTDKDGLTDSESYTVTVGTETTALAMTEEGMFYHISGALHGAYDLVTNATVGAAGDDADKDLINTDAAGATFTGSFEAGNSTMYVKDNAFDYDNATVEGATAAYAAGTASASVSNPAVGDIYVAKLRGGSDYAVLKVTALDAADNTCSCGNTGKITFSYKK